MPLAYEESAFELPDVTLAREDNRPRGPDQAEDSRSPIRLLLRNKYLKLSLCLVYRLSLQVSYQEGILQSARHTPGQRVPTSTIYELRSTSYDLSSTLYAYEVTLTKGDPTMLPTSSFYNRGDPNKR